MYCTGQGHAILNVHWYLLGTNAINNLTHGFEYDRETTALAIIVRIALEPYTYISGCQLYSD